MKTKRVRLPIRLIAAEIRHQAQFHASHQRVSNHEEGVDVRLQVHPDGQWSIHTGSADYDQDHRGVWGASVVPFGPRGGVSFDSMAMARYLINQCVDMAVDGGLDSDVMLYYAGK